ncbi:FtsW/RodA/SpoVE family cell cycle protein [Alkalihalobacterium bogoriense]|uniref:FtsW/RodA/SpoVE family cell cycle protein n=1 Tax=Alkalihalobacterium bogoriense TaxID=246272 RepID=UPI000479430D|nr:FtsW/RodA/SpoVE family cell cycle protein [Alkalihalobacterium bogoriense]
MKSSSPYEEFLNNVTSRVKATEAHVMIKKELTSHLVQLSQSFQKLDMTKEEADEKALEEMGNPFTIGDNLNQLHRPKMDWVLILLYTIIAVISFLPILNLDEGIIILSASTLIIKQLSLFTIGLLIIVMFLFFDYRRLQKWWGFFYTSGIILLLVTLVFGSTTMGALKWLEIGGFKISITPISFFLFFLAFSGFCYKVNEVTSWKKQMFYFGLLCFPIVLYLMLPDFFAIVIYFFCVASMFAFTQLNKRMILRLGLATGTLFIIVLSFIFGYAYFDTSRGGTFFVNRFLAIFTYLNPDTAPGSPDYLSIIIKDLLSQAGWFGNGYSDNILPLPESHTDFVFPYLVYTFGWAFGVFLCLLLLFFILRICFHAFKTNDLYGRLLVVGGASLFIIPTYWNILMSLGFLPIIGIYLPFISYGGTIVIMYSTILGLILSVYRRKDIVAPTIVVRG